MDAAKISLALRSKSSRPSVSNFFILTRTSSSYCLSAIFNISSLACSGVSFAIFIKSSFFWLSSFSVFSRMAFISSMRFLTSSTSLSISACLWSKRPSFLISLSSVFLLFSSFSFISAFAISRISAAFFSATSIMVFSRSFAWSSICFKSSSIERFLAKAMMKRR